METSRARINSTEKRRRRQRNTRFQIEHEILSKVPPPKKVMAWTGGTVSSNKDTALLAYLQRLQKEGKQLTVPQSQALERILTANFPEQKLDDLINHNKKKKDVEFHWNVDDSSDDDDHDDDDDDNNKNKKTKKTTSSSSSTTVKFTSRPERLGLGATHVVHKAAPESEEALAKKMSKMEKRRLRREQEEREMDEEETRRKKGEQEGEVDSRSGALTSRSTYKKQEDEREKEKAEEKKRIKREKRLRKKMRKKQKKEEAAAAAAAAAANKNTHTANVEDGVVIARTNKSIDSTIIDSSSGVPVVIVPSTTGEATSMRQMLKEQLHTHEQKAKERLGDKDHRQGQPEQTRSQQRNQQYPPKKKLTGYKKRKKTRSRQKNLKKDTRIAAAKPTFLTPGAADYNPNAPRLQRNNITIEEDRTGENVTDVQKHNSSKKRVRAVIDNDGSTATQPSSSNKTKTIKKKKKKKQKTSGTIVVGPSKREARVTEPTINDGEWNKLLKKKNELKNNDDFFNSGDMSNWD